MAKVLYQKPQIKSIGMVYIYIRSIPYSRKFGEVFNLEILQEIVKLKPRQY